MNEQNAKHHAKLLSGVRILRSGEMLKNFEKLETNLLGFNRDIIIFTETFKLHLREAIFSNSVLIEGLRISNRSL